MAYNWNTDVSYISKIQLPGESEELYIKDYYAREAIDKLSNATHFLGITDTPIEDGGTTPTSITLTDGKVYSLNPTPDSGEYQLTNGDIVIYKGSLPGTDQGIEFTCVINDTVTPKTLIWYEFGEIGFKDLGDLAYKNTASSTFTPNVTGSKGTLSIGSYTKASETVPVTLSTAAVTGATSFIAINTISSSVSVITGGTYSKPSTASVTVNSSATFSGAIPQNTVVTNITGGTPILNPNAIDLAFISSANNGTRLVYDVGSTAPVTGTITVPSTSVYGLDSSSASILSSATLTSTSAAAGNIPIASVSDEVLIISALAFTTAQAQVSTFNVGNAATYNLESGEAAITVNASSYKTTIAASTFVTDINAITPTKSAVDISVSGSAVTTNAVTFNTWDTVDIDITGKTTSVIPGFTTSTFYGSATLPSWGHTHDINGDIDVNGQSTSVVVS